MHFMLDASLLIVSTYSSSSTLSKTIPPPGVVISTLLLRRSIVLTGLQIDNTIHVRHGPDRDTRVKLIPIEIKSADGASVDSTPLLLETGYELYGFDLWRA